MAERAIDWTRDRLSVQDKEWLRSLPLQRRVHDFTIVHATLDTPAQWGYVFNNLDAVASFTYQRTTVCFFGHTHVPMVFVRDEGVRRETAEHIHIESGKKYFINAGSVGQPRDGNWRAGYCIYDVENRLVELLRIKYDVATAQKKIANAGLPRLLATDCLNYKHRGEKASGGQPWTADKQATASGESGRAHTYASQHRGYPVGNQFGSSASHEATDSCHAGALGNTGTTWPDNNRWNNVTTW